ncbi:hypothetical protein [Stenotrophomonas maltophilia]|uniref:hypothetical protein n=1 Tax=Stenotrophomonas maltophilia TaxID=40324 RepID=UPI001EF7D998|nr:hypothetical protein [Stenotrophomonas maltophilia]
MGSHAEATWNGLEVRQIRASDLDVICAHREAMFRESGRTEEVLRAMAAPFRAWLAPRLASGEYFGHVLADKGRTIAGIGLMLIDWPPTLHIRNRAAAATSSTCMWNRSTAAGASPGS